MVGLDDVMKGRLRNQVRANEDNILLPFTKI